MKPELGSDRAVLYPFYRLALKHFVDIRGYDKTMLIYVEEFRIDPKQVRFLYNGRQKLPYYDHLWQVSLVSTQESIAGAIFDYLDNYRNPAWLDCKKHAIEDHVIFGTGLAIGMDGLPINGLIGIWHANDFRGFGNCSLEHEGRK